MLKKKQRSVGDGHNRALIQKDYLSLFRLVKGSKFATTILISPPYTPPTRDSVTMLQLVAPLNPKKATALHSTATSNKPPSGSCTFHMPL